MTYKTFYAIALGAIFIALLFSIWFTAVSVMYSQSDDCYIEGINCITRGHRDSVAYWKHKGDSLQKEAEDLHYLYTK